LDIIISPLIEIVGLGPDMSLRPEEEVVFTSANGVRHGPAGDGRRAWCVGARTTRTAVERGWSATMAGETVEALLRTLAGTEANEPLVHLSGVHKRGDVVGNLMRTGRSARSVAIYDQVLKPLNSQAVACCDGGKSVIVPLFSPRTAEHFAKQVTKTSSIHAIALSRAVAEALGAGDWASVGVCSAPEAQAMRQAVLQRLDDPSMG
jgi:uroporphyrinogen-III synthase